MAPKIELSDKQKKIVFAENGPIYVKASAGSGKTRVLTERIRYLLGTTNKKVLALTFTTKAGDEINERLSDISEIDKRVFVGTFHGFCKYILENHGNLIGLPKIPNLFEKESDRLELIEHAIKQTPSYAAEYKTQDEKQRKDFRYQCLNFISKVKRELIADSELEQHTEDGNIVLFYQNYQDILRSQNAIDFDDLLLLAYSLLTNYPKTAGLYRRSFFAICIDEAQDLNNAQYQLLLALANGEFTNIMMVGDPNQAIYHFNGSSPEYMNKRFVHNFKPTIIELNENYRSSKEVLLAAKKIIPDTEKIPITAKDGIFEIQCFDDEIAEAKWIVDKIKKLIASNHDDIEGNITCEKIAVLARTKYVFNELEIQLNNNGLDFYYKMTLGMIQFESDLMKIFDLALRVRVNPLDSLHKRRLFSNLNITNTNNLSMSTIIPQMPDGLNKKIIKLVTELNDDGSNIKKALGSFKDNLYIDDENEKNMIFNDINELLKHWHNYAKRTDNKSLHQFKNSMALGQTHPLTQHKGITLSTVHTMKGQEFDIVFIIGMDDETFPDYRAIRSGGIEMIQEKNNLYVAFTRAKRFLYVTWPQKRLMPWKQSKPRKISQFLNAFGTDNQ